MCDARRTMNGVTVGCDVAGRHTTHHCPTWGVAWRDGGEIRLPQRGNFHSTPVCGEAGCNLNPKHKGPHGVQDTLL